MFGIFDCSGVSDGSAAAILCRAEDAHKYTDQPDLHQGALLRVAGPAEGYLQPGLRLHHLPGGGGLSAKDAYRAGRRHRIPREEISMAEVHDCFTPTELVLMEDMGFSQRGQAGRTCSGRPLRRRRPRSR